MTRCPGKLRKEDRKRKQEEGKTKRKEKKKDKREESKRKLLDMKDRWGLKVRF